MSGLGWSSSSRGRGFDSSNFMMEQELSKISGGRKVDLNTPKSLSKYFRDEVLATAEVQYAA